MKNEEIMKYYDYLMQLAVSKSNSQADAEDLVGETMLAAFTWLHSKKTIEYPKTWLTNTLYHKYNDGLRKKYRTPVTVYLDDGMDIPGDTYDGDTDYLTSEEAAKVRKELNHLGFVTREVLIRFYYGNQSVEVIAKGLGIPVGTVKSRLYAGRNQMKKGFERMENKDNYLPGTLYLSFCGSNGLKDEPMSLVEGDLIAQNLLILAYEKPLTISELSRAIGIPAAYIEPIVQKLVDGELMVQTKGGKIYSDFMITGPEEGMKNFQPQLAFARKHFDTAWNIVSRMSDDIAKLDFVQNMTPKAKTMLDRYAVLKSLQDFVCYGTNKVEKPDFPRRKDGGVWYAQGVAIDAGYDMTEYQEAQQYAIWGGHRTTEAFSIGHAKKVCLCEFDTTLWDNPHRYGGAYDLYFKHIISLLWHIYAGIPLEHSDIPGEFVSYMPTLETVGMIGYSEGTPYVKIPVLECWEYDKVWKRIQAATVEMKTVMGDQLTTFITSMRAALPKHLKTVPEIYRYYNATGYMVMAIVREAYDRGLHLKGVTDCCPPAVLIYDL